MLGGEETRSAAGGPPSQGRFAVLAALARDVAAAARTREVADATLRHLSVPLGARAGVFLLHEPEGGFQTVTRLEGETAGASDALVRAGDELARALVTGLVDWRPDTERCLIPLPAANAIVAFLCPAPATDAFAIASFAADVCGPAFVRALRYESERSERVAAARLGVMLEAGQAIARATDAKEAMTRLSELLVPRFADWATIDVLDIDGRARLASVACAELEKVVHPVPNEGESATPELVLAVLRSGEPLLLDDVDALISRAELPAAQRPSSVPQPCSAVIVPLAARQAVLGAMTLVSWRDGLRYDEMDVRLAMKIAQHAALALHNAHLIEAERAARREAQTANRMKDAFLATVSHELRTPLHAILGWATLLRSGKLDDAGKVRALETIERNARTQARLVDDVLDVSRIVSGKISLDLTAVEAQAALKQAVEVVWPVAQGKHVVLDVSIPSDVGRVRADRDRLVQVYWNVLSNAVKFTPAGGRVTLDATKDGATVRVRIKDTGKGIRPEFLPHLFEPFRQEDASTTRNHGGLGLGLSIARQLVRLHGGTISAHSDGEGTGATFIIELPSLER
jgi:signal transduction histidine kinase